MNRQLKEFFYFNIILIILIIITYFFKIRICIFYNIFKIPCVGCGLSRGVISILKFDILSAIRYNFLSIIIFFLYILVILWCIYDKIKKVDTQQQFITKNKKVIIILAIILVVIGWIVNINNLILK